MQCDNIFMSESYDGLDELEDLVYEDCDGHCEQCLDELFNFFDFDNTMLEKFPINLEYNANLFDAFDFDECFDKCFDEDYFDDCFKNKHEDSYGMTIEYNMESYDLEDLKPKSGVKFDEAIWARDNYETFNNYELQHFINGIEQLIVLQENMYEYREIVTDEDIDSLAELRKIKRLLVHKQNLIMGLAFKQASINFRKMKRLALPINKKANPKQACLPIKLPVFTNAFFESFKL